ncbi:unnamed protein product, partial [Arabidopsis halleri]
VLEQEEELTGNLKQLNQDNDDKTYPKTSHVGFGFVKPKDGKPFRTRDSDVVPLSYLLDDAKTRSRDVLIECGKLVLNHADERALGLHSLRFSETVEEVFTNLLPSVLCKYLFYLSEYYKFYTNFQVTGSEQETSRLLLCKATAIVMRKCFHLL